MRTLLLLLLLSTLNGFCQFDSLCLVNGVRIPAKIVSVDKKQVKYKNPHDTLGPTYVIPLKKVERFVLKDGCLDLKDKGFVNCKKDPTLDIIKNEDFTQTIISLNVAQTFNFRFVPQLDYIFSNRMLGFDLHYNYGMANDIDSSTYNRWECQLNGKGYYKKSSFGLDVKFFPFVHKKHTFWLSVGAERGIGIHKVDDYRLKATKYQNGVPYYVPISGPYSYYTEKFYQGYHLKIGLISRFKKHFVCQEFVSAGLSQFGTDLDPMTLTSDRNYNYYLNFAVGFTVGYAF